jgi:hypothetical protein
MVAREEVAFIPNISQQHGSTRTVNMTHQVGGSSPLSHVLDVVCSL